MAISATGENTGLTSTTASAYENPNGILGKDEFMMLLLAELQHKDNLNSNISACGFRISRKYKQSPRRLSCIFSWIKSVHNSRSYW